MRTIKDSKSLFIYMHTRTNVASVGCVFNDTRKVKFLSLPETIKEKSTFRAKPLRRGNVDFSFIVSGIVREPLPFAYRILHDLFSFLDVPRGGYMQHAYCPVKLDKLD